MIEPLNPHGFEVLADRLDGPQELALLHRERADGEIDGRAFGVQQQGFEEGQRVLAAGNGHGYAIAITNHLETMDRFTGLAQEYFFDVHLFIVEADRPQKGDGLSW